MSGPRGSRGGRVGIVEGWEVREARQREANSGAWKGLIFVVIAIVFLVVGGWIVARPVLGAIAHSSVPTVDHKFCSPVAETGTR